jgi:hypothetical protein
VGFSPCREPLAAASRWSTRRAAAFEPMQAPRTGS